MTATEQPGRGRTVQRSATPRKISHVLSAEDGFTIVEVVVSALLIVIISLAAFGAIESAGRSTAEERHRAQAHAIAEQDQARMRAMAISDLANYRETTEVTESGSSYTVSSRGDFYTDSTGTQSCDSASASADYIVITSKVTWPSIGGRPPILIKSIVTPPNGSTSATRGGLAIKVIDAQSAGIPGFLLTGSGAGTFSGETDANGCALFGNLPAGNYTLTPSSSLNLVDEEGDPPQPETISVTGQSTTTITKVYDEPGQVRVSFNVRVGSSTTFNSAQADRVTIFNTGMTAKTFVTSDGKAASALLADDLFPFTSPDTVYAGCKDNLPSSDGQESATVTSGATTDVTVQMPAITVTVTSNGSAAAGARIVFSDDKCSALKRTFTADSTGKLSNTGLPYGQYDICASYNNRKRTLSDQALTSFTSLTSKSISVTGSGSTTGTCPTS